MDTPSDVTATQQHPIRLIVNDDLQRTRLTVFFRLILAIPLLLWFTLWAVIATLALIANWIATLISGRSPEGLHNFLATFLRFTTHVRAYILLIADPYPPFSGAEGRGVVDVSIEPAARQSRWKIFFRFLLAYPASLLINVFQLVNFTLAFLGWFYCLFTGRMEPGLYEAKE